jgi:error-prone DNA polymerase
MASALLSHTDYRLPTTDYIELRCRSAFSFLSGASLPEDLIARAAELNYPALALGDHEGLYGAPRFHRAAERAGLRAIVGCNLQLSAISHQLSAKTGVRSQKSEVKKNTSVAEAIPLWSNSKFQVSNSKSEIRNSKFEIPPHSAPRTSHPALRTQHSALSTQHSLYLLVANRAGYRNLCRLLTQVKLRAPKGEAEATWEDLEGHTDGLICLAGGSESPLAPALRRRDEATALHLVRSLTALFGDRLYIDLQRHLDPEEERLNQRMLALARRCDVPIVATNDVRHATTASRPLLDVLTCIREKTTLDAAGRLLLNNAERYLKPAREMAALFRDLPEALLNTRCISERCEFTLDNLGYRFPDYPLPPGETAMGHLRKLTYTGARERYGTISARVRRQLEHELAIIEQLDLAGYFLIVWDIVRYCHEERILAQGRGSAANSAVCYVLGITAVDPIGMKLLFERFLSPERGEWPDIDIDLPSGDQREKVIQYVYRRYGERGAAMTANVITYRTRSAVREVGKVLGFANEQVDRLSKLLQRFEFRDDQDDLAKQLEAGGVDPAAPRVQLLVDLATQIQSLPRHLGQHSGGMVIAASRLDEIVPLEPAAMPGRVVVQWDKDDCADLGIIKVDLLGLGMLAVIEEAIPLVREHQGVEIDLAHLPQDDPAVYGMLQKADTIGVFQVESRAQMATLPRMKPERFYDLVVEVAIIRPGPIVGQMVHPYLDRRNGRAPVTYAHPSLEPILERTLGVPLFQEQLLRIAMTVAGFTAGEAEELRRAMGFKRSMARMREIEKRLRAGMAARGITGTTADEIVRGITSFALYGFPESHAASFALIAYASAYLRAHHLAAFTCAMLNNWPLGFYHPATLVKDAQRHGLRVLPIDVTRSEWRCTLEGQPSAEDSKSEIRNPKSEISQHSAPSTQHCLALRLGLRYVAGLRQEAAERLTTARKEAPFISIADVAARAQLRDNELETLAHIGAFAAFDLTRREALWQAAAVPTSPLFQRGVRGDLTSGREIPLDPPFSKGEAFKSEIRNPKSEILPEMSPVERTLADYKGTGMTVGPHIMKHLREELAQEGVLRACDLPKAQNGSWVKIAGLVIVRQRPGTAKGFCFLTLEDETGIGNAVVVPAMFQKHRALIHTAALLLVEGPLQKVDGVIHVRARRFRPLEIPRQAVGLTGRGYRMRVTPGDEGAPMPKSHDFR